MKFSNWPKLFPFLDQFIMRQSLNHFVLDTNFKLIDHHLMQYGILLLEYKKFELTILLEY